MRYKRTWRKKLTPSLGADFFRLALQRLFLWGCELSELLILFYSHAKKKDVWKDGDEKNASNLSSSTPGSHNF